MIPEKFYQEMQGYHPILMNVSGGMDSTYTALQFFEKGIQVILVHNNTYLTMKESKQTLEHLRNYTGYPYIELRPPKKEVKRIKESFMALQKATEMKDNGKYVKTVFKCCYYLKEKPFREFLKDYPNAISIISFRPGDKGFRPNLMRQLRKEGTFLHYKKKFKVMVGYPLRDTSIKEIRQYFKKIRWTVKHSGCKICPILLLFKMFKQEPKRYLASKRYYLSLTNKPCVELEPQTVLS